MLIDVFLSGLFCFSIFFCQAIPFYLFVYFYFYCYCFVVYSDLSIFQFKTRPLFQEHKIISIQPICFFFNNIKTTTNCKQTMLKARLNTTIGLEIGVRVCVRRDLNHAWVRKKTFCRQTKTRETCERTRTHIRTHSQSKMLFSKTILCP